MEPYYPQWLSYFNIFAQFIIFPTIYRFGTNLQFKYAVALYLVKDFVFDIEVLFAVHHFVAMYLLNLIQDNRSICDRHVGWIFTIAELGSGSFNVMNTSVQHNHHIEFYIAMFMVIMTVSNVLPFTYMSLNGRCWTKYGIAPTVIGGGLLVVRQYQSIGIYRKSFE